jgi:hypothetical protein
MRTHNYFDNGQSITKKQFESVVPSDWMDNLDEFGNYSWGYYSAKSI